MQMLRLMHVDPFDDIFSKLRYMIIGCECKWVVVDHLHMLVSAVNEGDERRACLLYTSPSPRDS